MFQPFIFRGVRVCLVMLEVGIIQKTLDFFYERKNHLQNTKKKVLLPQAVGGLHPSFILHGSQKNTRNTTGSLFLVFFLGGVKAPTQLS